MRRLQRTFDGTSARYYGKHELRQRAAALVELVAGQAVGPYRLVEEAGSGGMAVVWRAFHARLERYVAVKFLSPRYASDPEYLSRFEREARAISRLDHPNILTVYDYGEVEGWTYMVSPFVGGGTLAAKLKQGPWSLDQAIAVLEPLASALDYAHAEGIVHRDVKPSNILFTDRGRPVLADFGIARILEASTLLSHAGLVIGTPMYMSPEQADGQPSGPSSDLYSLGVVAYEMLTGRPPFTAETPLALLRAHIDKPLPPPLSVNPNMSEAVEAALFKMLAKAPADRFESGTKLVGALRGVRPNSRTAKHQTPGTPPPDLARSGGGEFALGRKLTVQPGRLGLGRTVISASAAAVFLFRLAMVVFIAVGLLTFLWPEYFFELIVPSPTASPTVQSPTASTTAILVTIGPRFSSGSGAAGLAPTVSADYSPTPFLPPPTPFPLAPPPFAPVLPTPTAAQAGATAIVPGQIVVVRGTGGTGARLRSQPGNAGPIITVIPEFTPLVVVGQDRIVDGIAWRNVRAPNGSEGWVAASFVTTG